VNFNVSKPIARLIWPRIKLEFVNLACSVYAHGLSLDSREIHSGTCRLRKSKCSKKSCRIADRNSARTVGENDILAGLAGLDGPLDGEVATRIKAKNTVASKSHAFSYVSSPFDLNDGNDIVAVCTRGAVGTNL